MSPTGDERDPEAVILEDEVRFRARYGSLRAAATRLAEVVECDVDRRRLWRYPEAAKRATIALLEAADALAECGE